MQTKTEGEKYSNTKSFLDFFESKKEELHQLKHSERINLYKHLLTEIKFNTFSISKNYIEKIRCCDAE